MVSGYTRIDISVFMFWALTYLDIVLEVSAIGVKKSKKSEIIRPINNRDEFELEFSGSSEPEL